MTFADGTPLNTPKWPLKELSNYQRQFEQDIIGSGDLQNWMARQHFEENQHASPFISVSALKYKSLSTWDPSLLTFYIFIKVVLLSITLKELIKEVLVFYYWEQCVELMTRSSNIISDIWSQLNHLLAHTIDVDFSLLCPGIPSFQDNL